MSDEEILRPDEATLLPELTDTAPTPEPEFEEGDYVPAPSREPGHRVNPHQVRRIPVDRQQRMSPLRPLMAARTAPATRFPEPVAPATLVVPRYAGLAPTRWARLTGGVVAIFASVLIALSSFIPFFVRNDSIALFSSTASGNAYILCATALAALLGGLLALTTSTKRLHTCACLLLGTAAVTTTVMTFYLLALPGHRTLIETGYDYGPAVWTLLAGLLILTYGVVLVLVDRLKEPFHA